MILMSAGIAVLGLLLSSPAVVIGAMLISPLMGPIVGLGFALAAFDFAQMRRAVIALAAGSAIAIAFASLIVLLSPLREVTSEILSRTRPNLFDLLIAMFAALAGAFAVIKGRSATIVGVAIATALMPPLAVVGFGLGTWNLPVLGGALALFVTNFVTIALSAAIMARIYGFGHALSAHQTWLQSMMLVLVFLVLAAPLAVSLSRISSEAVTDTSVRAFLSKEFGPRSQITHLSVDFDSRPMAVRAVVVAPREISMSNDALRSVLERKLGRPVTLQVDQLSLVGAVDSLEAQRSRLQAQAVQAATARTDGDLVARAVAQAAGVSTQGVTLDADHKRAAAVAEILPGADLQIYRTLEQRAAASAPGWRIDISPPFLSLPPIRFANGSDTIEPSTRQAIITSAWAARRWNARYLLLPGLRSAGARASHPRLDERRALGVAALLKAQGVAPAPAPAAGRIFRLALAPAPSAP